MEPINEENILNGVYPEHEILLSHLCRWSSYEKKNHFSPQLKHLRIIFCASHGLTKCVKRTEEDIEKNIKTYPPLKYGVTGEPFPDSVENKRKNPRLFSCEIFRDKRALLDALSSLEEVNLITKDSENKYTVTPYGYCQWKKSVLIELVKSLRDNPEGLKKVHRNICALWNLDWQQL